MLVKAVNDSFGFWHSLRQGTGVASVVESAKKKGDWFPFNLCRKDIEEVAVSVFGPGDQGALGQSWLVKADSARNELFRFGADRDGQMWVETFSELDEDELPEMKLNVAGIRFMHELVEMSQKHLEENDVDLLDKVSEYPTDLYVQAKRRAPREINEDLMPSEENESETDDESMSVSDGRRLKM